LRRAARPEGGTIDGLGKTLQDARGNALGGLIDARGLYVETAFGIEGRVLERSR
jgi:hypothetical protein